MASATKRIENAIESTIDQLGYELVDVEIGMENDRKILFIYIYHQDGVGLEDCETVSNAIDPIIDELDPIKDSFFLCVSSPGLERPLKKPRDFERNINKEIVLGLYQQIDGKKKFEGTLLAYDDKNKSIEIESDGQKLNFTLKEITKITPLVRFD